MRIQPRIPTANPSFRSDNLRRAEAPIKPKMTEITSEVDEKASDFAPPRLPQGKYPLTNLKGKINGMHILGAQLRGQPRSADLRLYRNDENKLTASLSLKATYPREGFRPNLIIGTQIPGTDKNALTFVGKKESVYLFNYDTPLYTDQAKITFNSKTNEIDARVQRTYDKRQYFQLFALGVMDLATLGLFRLHFGNLGETLKTDLIHGTSFDVSHIQGTIAPLPID